MKTRIKQTGEVFTPRSLIREMLHRLPNSVWFDPNKTWLEPSAGDGNFLVEIKARLLQAGHDERHILDHMLFSIELMDDNHWVLQHRLGYLVDGLPNPELWSESEALYWFKISKRHPLAQELNPRNPYAERLGLAQDEVLHHLNAVCWTALEYDMSFGREEQPELSLPLRPERDLGPWPATDTPDIGEQTVVERTLDYKSQLAHQQVEKKEQTTKKEPKPVIQKEPRPTVQKEVKPEKKTEPQGEGKGGWAVHPKHCGTGKKIRSFYDGRWWIADHDAVVQDINASLKEKGKKDLFEEPRPFSASSGLRGGERLWRPE